MLVRRVTVSFFVVLTRVITVLVDLVEWVQPIIIRVFVLVKERVTV